MHQTSPTPDRSNQSRNSKISFGNALLPGTHVPHLVVSKRIQTLTQPKKPSIPTNRSQQSYEVKKTAIVTTDAIQITNKSILLSKKHLPVIQTRKDHGDSSKTKTDNQEKSQCSMQKNIMQAKSIKSEVSETSTMSSTVRFIEVPTEKASASSGVLALRWQHSQTTQRAKEQNNANASSKNLTSLLNSNSSYQGYQNSPGSVLPLAIATNFRLQIPKPLLVSKKNSHAEISSKQDATVPLIPTSEQTQQTDRATSEMNILNPKYFALNALPKFALKPSIPIKYYTDQGFRPLLCAFRNMTWKDYSNRGRWHMFWANVANARGLFQPGQRHYFNDDQLVNHYSTCYHLSRKDNMTKNIKKYRMEMHQAKNPIAAKDKHGNFLYLDLIAPTYLLPFDFKNFVMEFKKHGGLWIVKPCSGSQGQGICLVNQLEQAKRWQDRAVAEAAASVHDNEPYQGFLISRYLANPLLVDGKKFDLRLYVLVTSFKPLRCYYYRQGFCRFCATKYSSDSASIDDKFMHLTNVAVQKHKKGYNRSHGNKWNIKAFRLYMERVYGRGKIDALFDKIFWMIVQSLKSVQPLMDNDRHCYEMYGYDCLIDAYLKPWLLEINASPSLEDSTPIDRVNKTSLLMDTMRMAMYERSPHLLGISEKRPDGEDMPLGDYEILYLEEPTSKVVPTAKKVKKVMGRYGPAYGPALVPTQSGIKEKPRWNSF